MAHFARDRSRNAALSVMLLLLAATLGAACSDVRSEALPAVVKDDLATSPQNVILFIADGLGVSSIATTETILLRQGHRLVVDSLPVTGLVRTTAESLLVPESASTATSLATGFKTKRRYVGVDAAGRSRKTILEAARDDGFVIGLITNTRLTDATPAAFAAHVTDRGDHGRIASHMIAARVDILSGGSGGVFTDSLLAVARLKGYTVAQDPSEIEGPLPVLALHRERAPNTEAYGPPLTELTRSAIDVMHSAGRPFFLVIEQEETDSGAHNHDLPRVLEGVIELDDALRAALRFARAHGNTLVILTADHDTAGYSEIEYADGVQWLTGGHTNQWVPLFAFGPGQERFTGVHENTEIPRILADLLGLHDFPEHP